MDFTKTTEQDSYYNNLERMTVNEIVTNMNKEDKSVPLAVEKALPFVEILITEVINKLEKGGRLFYLGAGTSGRLGILDASECPPTFGVPHGLVIGLSPDSASALVSWYETVNGLPSLSTCPPTIVEV